MTRRAASLSRSSPCEVRPVAPSTATGRRIRNVVSGVRTWGLSQEVNAVRDARPGSAEPHHPDKYIDQHVHRS